MRGVYAVAAELSRLGFIASPTSRGARGADLLVTDQEHKHAFSVEVKTDTTGGSVWLVRRVDVSPSHVYVLVRFRPGSTEFYIVPSVEAARVHIDDGSWSHVRVSDVGRFRDAWDVFDS